MKKKFYCQSCKKELVTKKNKEGDIEILPCNCRYVIGYYNGKNEGYSIGYDEGFEDGVEGYNY